MFEDITSVPFSQIFEFYKVTQKNSTEYFVYYSNEESNFWVFKNSDRNNEINCISSRSVRGSGMNFEIITKQQLLLQLNENIDFDKINFTVSEIRAKGIEKEEGDLEGITANLLKKAIFNLFPIEDQNEWINKNVDFLKRDVFSDKIFIMNPKIAWRCLFLKMIRCAMCYYLIMMKPGCCMATMIVIGKN